MQHLGLIVATAVAIAVGVVSTVVLLRRRHRVPGVLGAVLTAVLVAAVAVGAPARLGLTAPEAAADAAPSVSAPVLPTATWVPATIRSGPGYPRIDRLRVPLFPAALRDTADRAPSAMPAHGAIVSVVIPPTRSRFVARPTIVYLPPAARVAQPRLLPVVIAFSGQSKGAGPTDLVWSGHLEQMMDRIAARHHGVAPIVVVPDQLGPATGNPMCVNSKHFGNVATYVMDDVRGWVLHHLPVETGRKQWTVAGFSEGGTCSIQFASAHPDVFGSLVDVSGERAPANGSLAHTIEVGFGGSRTAYEHATPAWILAHHRYRDEQALFAYGALDRTYGPVAPVMAHRAARAGMTAHVLRIPALGHNWNTASAGLTWGLDRLVGWWGI